MPDQEDTGIVSIKDHFMPPEPVHMYGQDEVCMICCHEVEGQYVKSIASNTPIEKCDCFKQGLFGFYAGVFVFLGLYFVGCWLIKRWTRNGKK